MPVESEFPFRNDVQEYAAYGKDHQEYEQSPNPDPERFRMIQILDLNKRFAEPLHCQPLQQYEAGNEDKKCKKDCVKPGISHGSFPTCAKRKNKRGKIA